MPPPEAATRHYLEQKAITAGIVRRARRAWAKIDPANLDESWRSARVGDELLVITATGQSLAAGRADDYLDAVLTEQGIDIDRTGTVASRSFAGVASDGRDLDSLLYEPVIASKVAIGRGRTPAEALRSGEASLVRIVATQLQDAGREAVHVGMVARPAVTSYVRMLVPPSCARCAILAGRVYKYNAGFLRHPHCSCKHIPSTENVAGDLTTDPNAYFRSLGAADQDRYFTQAGAESIRRGADIRQVVNARRGLYQADGQLFTTIGTTKRGIGGKRLKGQRREMPETLLARAKTREESIELLRQHGYLL